MGELQVMSGQHSTEEGRENISTLSYSTRTSRLLSLTGRMEDKEESNVEIGWMLGGGGKGEKSE